MARKRLFWWLVGGVAVIGALFLIQVRIDRPGARPEPAGPPDAALGPRPKVKGPDSAPVKVTEFADFQ